MKHPFLTLVTIGTMSSLLVAQVAKARPTPEKPQALTYASIVSHFKASGLRTTEVQKRCTILFEGEWANADVYNYGIIIVENSDEDVQVTFYLTDAHEMNWITEFLDAPFFTPSETQKLFSFVNGGTVLRQKVGRFRVDFHKCTPRHAQIFVFSFTKR